VARGFGAGEARYARWSRSAPVRQPVEHRLAFRELGLAIGLEGVEWMGERAQPDDIVLGEGSEARALLRQLSDYLPVGERIVSFRLEEGNRLSQSWAQHEDINAVMLATALVPEGFLGLPSV